MYAVIVAQSATRLHIPGIIIMAIINIVRISRIYSILLGMNVIQDLAIQKMAVYVMPDVCVRQFSDGMHLLNVVVSQ